MEHRYFGLFSEEQIKVLIKSILSKKSKAQDLVQDDVALERLSKKLVGYSNRTIDDIINSATHLARNSQRSPITESFIERALEEGSFEKIDESKYKKGSDKVQQKTILGFGA